MILGNDISDNNGQIDWATYKNNTNFIIMKVSEGSAYIDKWFGYNREQARQNTLPLGYYHFARPDLGNSAIDEANFFVNLINGSPLQAGEILALDYEVQWNGNNVQWCKDWLDHVASRLGVKPLFYSYQDMLTTHDWTPVVKSGYGLWVAAPTNNPNDNNFVTGAWSVAAIQQWGNEAVPGIPSGVVDADIFFGDTTQFKKYGYQPPAPPPPPTPPTNPCKDIEQAFEEYKQTHPDVSASPITATPSPVPTVTPIESTPPSPTTPDPIQQLIDWISLHFGKKQ